MDKVSDKLDRANIGRIVMDGLLREVVRTRLEAYARLEEKEMSRNPHASSSEDITASDEQLSTENIAVCR